MKENRLYRVTSHNKHFFDWGGLTQTDKQSNPWNYADDLDITQQYKNSTNAFGLSKQDNPFSKGNLQGGIGAMAKTGIGSGLLGAASGIASQGVQNLIGGGYNSGAGNAIGSVGRQVGSAVGAVNPLLGAAINVGSGIIGGGVNALWGTKTNQELLNKANESINAFKGYTSTAGSFDDVTSVGPRMDVGKVYKGGAFKKGWARRKNEALQTDLNNAYAFAENSVDNNVNNLIGQQSADLLANYSAFGGPLGMIEDTGNMGAIDYGFMQDYLTAKRQQAVGRDKVGGVSQMPVFMALGGDIQRNGADFTNGLAHIDAGGRHEENPNEGVQVGVDQEGVPNLVEEGETIFNDYVYSARILADAETKQRFHLPKKKDISFADISKKLEKEAAERPNDPISQAGLKAQMSELAEHQERQKQEMEAQRAREAFEALSPEEQTAVMQQMVAQQQGMQEQGEAALLAQPTEQVAEQQMADGSQANLGVEPQMNCMGGKINRFDGGGKKSVGTWKDDKQNHWDVFTKPGLMRYLEDLKAKLQMAPDDATKETIRRNAMNELNSLQQSYFDHVLPTSGADKYSYSDDIRNHQLMFDKLYGNTGFYSTDDNGNVRNLIAEAINLPKGASTDDKPDHWADGYNGRRTSIRNFGSTEYGDDAYYQDLVDNFASLGLTFAPNENWKYGDHQLYGLSLPNSEGTNENVPKVWDWNTGSWIDRPSKNPVIAPPDRGATEEDAGGEDDVAPKHRAEWLRYAGLFGPAVGLGMMAAGVGKPSYADLDAAVETGSGPAHQADYRPLGNYLRYRPMDIWYEQNRLNANARATDRNIMNTSGGNRGTAMAGLLANGYNDQIGSGNLYRQALEYNDAQRQRVAEFNRGTDQFNADSYNRTSQFNTDALNRQKQYKASLAMQAAQQKMDADAGWYNSLYGNVSGLFKGIGDLGAENYRMNRIAEMAARGDFGTATDKTYGFSDYLTSGKNKGRKNK